MRIPAATALIGLVGLVAIAIVSVTWRGVGGWSGPSSLEAQTRHNARRILGLLKFQPGKLPTSVEEFLEQRPDVGARSKESWGTALRLESDSRTVSVRSAGPDRVMDSDDDLVETFRRWP